VSIEYRQIGFCNSYTTPGGVRAAKPDEVYAVYKIEAVDNAKRTEDFTFIPTRLFVDPGEWGEKKTPWKATPGATMDVWFRRDRRRYVSSDTGFAQAMGVRALVESDISHGQKKEIAAYAILEVPMPGEGQPVEQISFKLSYDRQEGQDQETAGPPVVLNNVGPAQTSWPHPENCQELTLDRLPS
jgi:hypothetical protein